MIDLRKICAVLALAATTNIAAIPAKADLIAAQDEQAFVQLNPLRNGLSAITLTWPLADLTQQKQKSVSSGLLAVLAAGTEDLPPYESNTFRRLHGINFQVSFEGATLLLTMTAPANAFDTALGHLGHTLNNPTFAKDRYRRELVQLEPQIVTKNRRPSDFLNDLVYQSKYLDDPVDIDVKDFDYQFGWPKQVIMRSNVPEHKAQAERFLRALAKPPSNPISRMLTNLSYVQVDHDPAQTKARAVTLPKGLIYLADPDASEMMIMLVKAETYENETQQVAANLLMNYIGAHQGSEMFRVIRQEMRAAYNPRSFFEITGKNQAILSLSATVAAQEWPEILATMQDIYTDTRDGNLSDTGFRNVHVRLVREYNGNFSTNPVWGVQNLLREYPEAAKGEIRLPLFNAVGTADLDAITSASADFLPPIDDYLVILIGGGDAPSQALRSSGFCVLEANEHLNHCLQELDAAQR